MKKRISKIEEMQIHGRCALKSDGLYLFWTGSGLEMNLSAGELTLEIEAYYSQYELWIDVLLGDERTMRFPLKKGRHEYTIFKGMDPEKSIRVRVLRDTQCMSSDSDICSVIKIISADTDGEFLPVKAYPYCVEFIGDSITSGEGCSLMDREEWVSACFDAVRSYPFLTAEKLGCRYDVISESGWGLVAGWDGNTESNIPRVYPFICGSQENLIANEAFAGREWDFDANKKSVVVINLGTNDESASACGRWSREEYRKMFVSRGKGFLNEVRNRNKQAYIIWAYGMLGQDMKAVIEETVSVYKKESGDERTSFLLLPDSASGHLGARNHPDLKGHEMAAQALASYFQVF